MRIVKYGEETTFVRLSEKCRTESLNNNGIGNREKQWTLWWEVFKVKLEDKRTLS